MSIVAQGSTTEHPAVIPTSPPRQPFMHIVRSYSASPNPRRVSVNIEENAPAAAERVLVTAQRAATSPHSAEEVARVEPGLNQNHLNQKNKVPRT